MRKSLAALVALIWLLPRVEPRVLNQVVFVFERLAADGALVRTPPCTGEKDKSDNFSHFEYVVEGKKKKRKKCSTLASCKQLMLCWTWLKVSEIK